MAEILSEYIRVELPELKRFDAEIDGLQDRLRELRAQRQAVIDAEAMKIATCKAGDRFEWRKKTYVITGIGGDYVDYIGTDIPPVISVRYRGHVEFKNGNTGSTVTVHPPEKKG